MERRVANTWIETLYEKLVVGRREKEPDEWREYIHEAVCFVLDDKVAPYKTFKRGIKSFEGYLGRIATWLKRKDALYQSRRPLCIYHDEVYHTKLTDRYDQHNTEETITVQEEDFDVNLPERTIQVQLDVQKALQVLDAETRHIVWETHTRGATQAELAKELKVDQRTIGRRLAYAEEVLRGKLNAYRPAGKLEF